MLSCVYTANTYDDLGIVELNENSETITHNTGDIAVAAFVELSCALLHDRTAAVDLDGNGFHTHRTVEHGVERQSRTTLPANAFSTDHSYVQPSKCVSAVGEHAGASTSKRKNNLKARSDYVTLDQLDHDYMSARNISTTYVRGCNVALDKIVDIVKQQVDFDNSPSVSTNSNLMSLELSDAIQPPHNAALASALMNFHHFKADCIRVLSKSLMSRMKQLRARKNGYISCLRRNDIREMTKFTWTNICCEFIDRFPDLFQLVLNCMVNNSNMLNPERLHTLIPRLAVVYSIIAFSGNSQLSLTQRLLATLLHDSNCDRVVSLCVHILYSWKCK